MIIEIYKDVVGYEGLYQVSNLGNVISLLGKTPRNLKFDIHKSKLTTYFRVTLSKNSVTSRMFVHRLVAEAFIPNIYNKSQVNHIDNIGTHNQVNNLEWVSGKENMLHSSKQGRQDVARHLGMLAAKKMNQEAAEIKYKTLLQERFINTYTIEKHKHLKRVVTFKCICGNTYTERVDNAPLRLRAGICNHCKDEDIVSSM